MNVPEIPPWIPIRISRKQVSGIPRKTSQPTFPRFPTEIAPRIPAKMNLRILPCVVPGMILKNF